MTTSPTPANWASILALGLIWGGTFMVMAMALEGYGPVTVAAARTTLGAVSLSLIVLILRRPLPGRETTPHVVWSGLLSTAVPFMLLSWGLQYVPSAFAGLSMAMVPLFVLPLAFFFSDEAMSGRTWIGVTLGFVGALVLFGPGLLDTGTERQAILGQLACVAAALCYAIASIATRRCPPVDPISFAAATLVVGMVPLVPAVLLIDGVPRIEMTRPGIAIIVLGLFPTAFAALLRVAVIRSAGSVFLTLVNYQVPLWSVFFGWLVLSEMLPWRFFAALGLILIGLLISQARRRQPPTAR